MESIIENKKYKLTGYTINGGLTNKKWEEIAVNKNGNWYRAGCNKILANFVILKIEEL